MLSVPFMLNGVSSVSVLVYSKPLLLLTEAPIKRTHKLYIDYVMNWKNNIKLKKASLNF